MSNKFVLLPLALALSIFFFVFPPPSSRSTVFAEKLSEEDRPKKYLYVAVPGIRNYLGYGGHGVLVFDIESGHRFIKRIPTQGYSSDGNPSNVKGIAVSIPLNSLFISTLEGVQRLDLKTETIVWERAYEGGADRLSISPDGMTMYLPSLEKDYWNVINCETGDRIASAKW